MEIHVDFTNNHFEMSFIPVDFYSLESTFGHLPIHQIKNLNLGFFPMMIILKKIVITTIRTSIRFFLILL